MFSVLNVLARLGVNVLLGQAKVDNVHDVFAGHVVPPHQEVLRLHVTVDQVFVVHVFNSCNLKKEAKVSGDEKCEYTLVGTRNVSTQVITVCCCT